MRRRTMHCSPVVDIFLKTKTLKKDFQIFNTSSQTSLTGKLINEEYWYLHLEAPQKLVLDISLLNYLSLNELPSRALHRTTP